jgi:hypothetical protein
VPRNEFRRRARDRDARHQPLIDDLGSTELLVIACDVAGNVYGAIRRRQVGVFVVHVLGLAKSNAHV